MYFIEKNINKLKRGEQTLFLNEIEYKKILSIISKNTYNIFYPFIDSNKYIIYKERLEIKLYEIILNGTIKHSDILGSLLSLNIDEHLIGDIICTNNRYYMYISSSISNYIETNLIKIKNYNIKLEELDINYLKDYQVEYEKINIIVSSLRSDNLISKLIKTSRDIVKDMIKDKLIRINYELLNKPSYVIKENDIISIRKYGKYRFIGIIKETKKDNYLIEVNKYK